MEIIPRLTVQAYLNSVKDAGRIFVFEIVFLSRLEGGKTGKGLSVAYCK